MNAFDDVYIAYLDVADKIAWSEKGVKTHLGSAPETRSIADLEIVSLGDVGDKKPIWPAKALPSWPKKEKPEKPHKPDEPELDGDTGDKVEITVSDFSQDQKEIIEKRLGKEFDSPQQIKMLVDEIAVETTLIIRLTQKEYDALCSKLACKGTVELADKIKESLIKRVS